MSTLLSRRREMMKQAGGPLPEWDVVWEYTDGLPGDNGWTKTTAGTIYETIQDNGLEVSSKGSNNNVTYEYPASMSRGVFEVKFHTNSSSQFHFVVGIKASETSGVGIRAQYSTNNKGIYLPDGSTLAESTKLANFALNTDYTVRFELDNGYADIYVNNDLVASAVDISTVLLWNDKTSFRFYSTSSSRITGNFIYAKLKIGRL